MIQTSAVTTTPTKFCCPSCSASYPPAGHAYPDDHGESGVNGSRFSDTWAAAAWGRYQELPEHKVTLRSFFQHMRFALGGDAKAILVDQRDFRVPYPKLIRANGTCLRGEWRITEDTPYTGYFRRDSVGLVIARASIGLSATKLGTYRAFGMAIKLFPTRDATDVRTLRTANVFVIDDNAGTLTPHYLDAPMANMAAFSKNRGALQTLPLLGAITIAQRLADTFSRERQLYPVAELGEAVPETARAPRFLRITGAAEMTRVAVSDFRNELEIARYPGAKLRFDIAVRDVGTDAWARIGELAFTEDVCSAGCDHRLQFPHPVWR